MYKCYHEDMAFDINFSEEKNQLLRATRGVCFDDAIKSVKSGNLLANIAHPSQKYPHQKIYVINLGGYAYAIPYVINKIKRKIFLKTMYPSKALTKKYINK